jgi:hypothetical protein
MQEAKRPVKCAADGRARTAECTNQGCQQPTQSRQCTAAMWPSCMQVYMFGEAHLSAYMTLTTLAGIVLL